MLYEKTFPMTSADNQKVNYGEPGFGQKEAARYGEHNEMDEQEGDDDEE